MLSPLQSDLLRESINIGLGSGLAPLSKLVRRELDLNIPSVHFERLARLPPDLIGPKSATAWVRQPIIKPFQAEMYFFLKCSDGLTLLRHIDDDPSPLSDLTDLEEDALVEIGNTIVDSICDAFSETFMTDVKTGLPVFGSTALGMKPANGPCHESLESNLVVRSRFSFLTELTRSEVVATQALICNGDENTAKLTKCITESLRAMGIDEEYLDTV